MGWSSALAAPNIDATTGPILVTTLGIVSTAIGLCMLSTDLPSGHLVSPGRAAKLAFDYNQNLKKKLGLPENYDPR